MDSIDDDFGDLYADVEVQVKSAISNAPEFTKLYTESVPEPHNNNNNRTPNSKSSTLPEEKLASESTRKALSIEGDDESDSEDELKIVLNDEDCERFHVKEGFADEDEGDDSTDHAVSNGAQFNTKNNDHVYSLPCSQYKYVRSHGSTLPSNFRVNGSAKGDWEDNGLNSGQIARVRAGRIANSVVPQCAYGFSLPWYRTIVDINIDTFEDKPWTHPGANISDFFNFGFNEESWKRYCSLLDKCRNHTFTQAYESGIEHEKVDRVARTEEINHVGSSSKLSDQGKRPLELPKGRTIEVENSIVERQPSMDIRRPRFRDSDVVIEINVQDDAEDFSGSVQEEVGHIDSNSNDRDTSSNRNLEQLDRKKNVHSCGGASDDKLLTDSIEKDFKRNFDMASAFRRCSEKTCASNQMSLGSDSQGNGKISEQDECHHENMSAHASGGTSEAMETLTKETVGMNRCKSDSSLIEAELSLGNQDHFTLSRSSSGSYSELSKDSVHGDPAKSCALRRKSAPNSGTELLDSVASGFKNSTRNGLKIKQGEGKYYSRYRSPSEEDWKHHRGRHHRVKDRKIYHASDDFPSPLSNAKGDGKSYLEHGHVKEKKHCHGMCFSTSEQKDHHDSGAYTSLMSDAEGLYDRNYMSVDSRGRKLRWHDCDYHNADDFAYRSETKISSLYNGERSGDYHFHVAHNKHPCWKYYQSFRDLIDPCCRKKGDEREYNLERSARVDNEDAMGRNWHQCEKGFPVGEKIPFAYGESRRLAPEYSSTFKVRHMRWRSKSDELQSGNRISHDGSLRYYQEDDFLLENEGRPFTNRKRDSLDRTYEGCLPLIRRKAKISVQRGRYCDSFGLHLDESKPIEVKNGYHRCQDHPSSISQSYRECYPASRGRWHGTVSSTDDVYDCKVKERYGRPRRHICDEKHRDDGWFGIYNDTDDTKDSIMDHMDPIRLGGGFSWQSKELHRMEDELLARYQDEECFAEKASFSYEQIAEYESDHNGILIDDAQLDRYRYHLIRERSNGKCVNGNCTVLRCRDAVDLIVGEGKSSGRCPSGKSLMCNSRLEKMELKVVNEQTTSKGFHESERGKVVKGGILKIERNKDTEKWLSKYQVTEHNDDLDIGEGQIIMEEEPDTEKQLEKKRVPKNTVATHNLKKRVSCSENACNVSNNVRDYGKQHILETLAKMEKRRERFKDPITFKKEVHKNTKPQADLMVDTAESKQQRPARKMRWGAS